MPEMPVAVRKKAYTRRSTHYRRRRDHGDGHTPALRNLFNRQLGQLWYCLQTGQPYDPVKAFANFTPPPVDADVAA